MASTATKPPVVMAESNSSSDAVAEAKVESQAESEVEAETEKKAEKETDADADGEATPFKPTARYWTIIITCAIIGLLSALENTVVTTALAQVAAELNLQANYVWVTNAFFLAAAAVQPLFGQLANLYGRRWITMIIVAFFTLGSGIAGGSTNGSMLIAGRAVQGIGSGGLYIIIDIIVSDLVPLRQRGNYMAVILTVYTVGMAIGPWLGGEIVATTTWRWVFWICVPVGGVSMIMIYFFLHMKHDTSQSPLRKLMRVDYIGNLILIASTGSILYALTYGGTTYPWSSSRVITPLIVGFAGFVFFLWYETKASEPVIPPELFRNRTAVIIFVATFFNTLLLYWVLFFLPLYFQAVLGTSGARAGVILLPSVLFGIPGAIVAVLLLTKFGKYKPIHLMGFAVSIIGLGLFSLLNEHSSLAVVVIFQAVSATGGGFVLNTLLPAVQAQLPESQQAAVTASFAFMRSLGSIWGVAVPAAIFNNQFAKLLNQHVKDPQVRALFDHGNRAYENGYAAFVQAFPEPSRSQIISTYSDALKFMWQVSIAFAAVNFLIVIFEKQTTLRTELETEFGLEEESKGKKTTAHSNPAGLEKGLTAKATSKN